MLPAVYFCSGQSNMAFPLKYAYNPAEEMATLKDYKDFRFFATAKDYSAEPRWDLRPSPGSPACAATGSNGSACAMACDAEPCNQWLTVENATAAGNAFLQDFSAVCGMHLTSPRCAVRLGLLPFRGSMLTGGGMGYVVLLKSRPLCRRM